MACCSFSFQHILHLVNSFTTSLDYQEGGGLRVVLHVLYKISILCSNLTMELNMCQPTAEQVGWVVPMGSGIASTGQGGGAATPLPCPVLAMPLPNRPTEPALSAPRFVSPILSTAQIYTHSVRFSVARIFQRFDRRF